MPSTSLLAEVAGSRVNSSFEYPGGHVEKSPGDARAKLRIEAEEARADAFVGYVQLSRLHGGPRVQARRARLGRREHRLGAHVGVHRASQEAYTNTFEAFPKKTPFRPPRITPKPAIPGTQTAVVVGKSGEEQWTDEYGRIKVQFHWIARARRTTRARVSCGCRSRGRARAGARGSCRVWGRRSS